MTVIFKLGGSLLTAANLTEKIRQVLTSRATQRCLIIPGGGAMADVVRGWSQIHNLNDEAAHWLAIACLEMNGRLLHHLFGWPTVRSREEAHAAWRRDPSPLLLDVSDFAKAEMDRDGDRIPHNWSVTSDSLATWIAKLWPAEELIFLKSVPIPSGQTALQASQNQLVDPYFPSLCCQVPTISWCDVRAQDPAVEPWLANPAEGRRGRI